MQILLLLSEAQLIDFQNIHNSLENLSVPKYNTKFPLFMARIFIIIQRSYRNFT